MQTTADKIIHIVGILEQMLLQPFPKEQEPHDEDVAFQNFERFKADAPDRLTQLIGDEFFDDEYSDNEGDDEDETDRKAIVEKRHRGALKLYDDCLAMIEQAWGPGNRLSRKEIIEINEYRDNKKQPENKQHPFYTAPGILFDEDRIILGDYDYAMTWWPKANRVALLHYIQDSTSESGRTLWAVSICVLPLQTTYKRPEDY